MKTHFCPVDNFFTDRRYCDGTTMVSKKYSCRSHQCRALRPTKATVELSRTDFQNGYETVHQNNLTGYMRDIYIQYQARHINGTVIDFLDEKKKFHICSRHLGVNVPFQFVKELTRVRPVAKPAINLTIHSNGPTVPEGNNLTTQSHVRPTSQVGSPDPLESSYKLLMDLVNRLPASEATIHHHAVEMILDSLRRNAITTQEATDKIRDFLEGQYAVNYK